MNDQTNKTDTNSADELQSRQAVTYGGCRCRLDYDRYECGDIKKPAPETKKTVASAAVILLFIFIFISVGILIYRSFFNNIHEYMHSNDLDKDAEYAYSTNNG